MTEQFPGNPYQTPGRDDVPLPSTPPGLLAAILIIVVAIVASVCTFFCTCIGVGISGYEALGGATLAVAATCGLGAALAVGTLCIRAGFGWFTPKQTECELPASQDR